VRDVDHAGMRFGQKLLLLMCLWVFGGFALLYATLAVSPYYSVALAILILGVLMAVQTLRCPHCGKQVTHREVRIRSLRVEIPIAWVERKCSRCGTALDAEESRKA
jgi:endogenous inhibitor of DNA gyrase (YacG/DUF329 family)